jgi:sulfur relay (sulfurtransferase) complex TusBCD TusD component (DsrE family)
MTYEEKQTMRFLIEETVRETLRQQNPKKDEMTRRQAIEAFGKGNLNHWEATGRITFKRAGTHKNSKKIYSRKALEDLAEATTPKRILKT